MTVTIAAIAVLTFIVSAATGTPPAPDLTGLAALITAGVGIIAFLMTLYRGRENNKKVAGIEEATLYIQGYKELMDRLKEEIDEIREEHHNDQRQWGLEKDQFRTTINELRTELNKQVASNNVLRGELADIRSQIRSWLSDEDYDEFQKHFQRDSRS